MNFNESIFPIPSLFFVPPFFSNNPEKCAYARTSDGVKSSCEQPSRYGPRDGSHASL